MATTSKIKEIGTQREYDYKEKHYRATVLTMENSDKGECSQTKADAFTVGQELVYNLKPNGEYTPKMYLETPKPSGGKGSRQKEDPIERMIGFAFAYSKDLAVAKVIDVSAIVSQAKILLGAMKECLEETKNTPHTQQTTPVAQTTASELITPEQIKYAHTLWSKTGQNDESWKKYISDTYKVGSSKDLTKHQASEFIEYIKTLEPMPLPTKLVDDDLPF